MYYAVLPQMHCESDCWKFSWSAFDLRRYLRMEAGGEMLKNCALPGRGSYSPFTQTGPAVRVLGPHTLQRLWSVVNQGQRTDFTASTVHS